jgi:hypothetical protein
MRLSSNRPPPFNAALPLPDPTRSVAFPVTDIEVYKPLKIMYICTVRILNYSSLTTQALFITLTYKLTIFQIIHMKSIKSHVFLIGG